MPTSLMEHFDAIWISLTVVIGFIITLLMYFIRSWKTEVDENLKKLTDKNTVDDVELVKKYVSKEECSKVMHSVLEEMKDLNEKVDKYHSQVMYEFGLRNGTKHKGA